MDLTQLQLVACFKFLGIGLAMGLGMLGPALGLGMATKAILESIARQPECEQNASKYFFVGAGLIEACAIYALVLALIMAFVLK